MGRVRMRVRDIDYSDEAKPVQDLLSSPDKKTSSGGSSPGKRASSVTKLKEGKKDKAGKDAKKGKEIVKGKKSSESNPGQTNGENDMLAVENDIIDPNEI